MPGRFVKADGAIVANASWRSAVGRETVCT
jgi:hypothetical protein